MSTRERAGGVLEALTGSLRDDEAAGSGATFMRGLTLGALIGAAVAGSAIWQRRMRNARAELPSPSAEPVAELPVESPPDGGVDPSAPS